MTFRAQHLRNLLLRKRSQGLTPAPAVGAKDKRWPQRQTGFRVFFASSAYPLSASSYRFASYLSSTASASLCRCVCTTAASQSITTRTHQAQRAGHQPGFCQGAHTDHAVESLAHYAAYAAMNGAIEVLSRYLAKELGPRGIAVNVVAPGAIETDFGDGAVRDNAQLNAFVASQTALGRVGVAEDIGPLVAAPLQPATRWVNAQRVEASGGKFV